MNVTGELIEEFRIYTSFRYGIIDCKHALLNSGLDFEKARKYLEEFEPFWRIY